MARRKNRPEAIKEKTLLSERLRDIRIDLFGERGGSEMARRLGLPVRTWYNYESGVTVPAEVLLRFVELTAAEPVWLLHGQGPRYRESITLSRTQPGAGTDSVRDLLRTALRRLEDRDDARSALPAPRYSSLDEPDLPDLVLVPVDPADSANPHQNPEFLAAQREWLDTPETCRCVRVEGDAMQPILADGAYAAFSATAEPYDDLAGRLVVAWVQGKPVVRWFEPTGGLGILRAENPHTSTSTLLIDLNGPAEQRQVRRVIGTSSPH